MCQVPVAHILKESGIISKLIEFVREIERIQKEPMQKQPEPKTNFNGWYQGTWVCAQGKTIRFFKQESA